MLDVETVGCELGDWAIGMHLALTSLPGYAVIDGVVERVEPLRAGGAWLHVRARPFDYNIPVSRFVRASEPVLLHPEPVEAVLARG